MPYPDGMPASAIEDFYGEDPSSDMEEMENIQAGAFKLLNEVWGIEAEKAPVMLGFTIGEAIQHMDKLVRLSQDQKSERDHEIMVMKDTCEDNNKEGFIASAHELFRIYHSALVEAEAVTDTLDQLKARREDA